jgi:hypothetical protein
VKCESVCGSVEEVGRGEVGGRIRRSVSIAKARIDLL